MPIETVNPDMWKLVGTLNGDWSGQGGKNFNWGTVPTVSQTLTAVAALSVYRLQASDQNPKQDYYLVLGDVYHGIQGSPADPVANWFSVGFYANYMNLKLSSSTPQARVISFGPNSTEEQASLSFSVGIEFRGEITEKAEGKAIGSLSASVGISFSASEVSFAARPSRSSIEWNAALPRVGWQGPSSPANPGEPSYAGYIWNPAVIFEVPQGAFPALEGQLTVDFEYNWTRGIRARGFNPKIDLVFTPLDNLATDGDIASLPTIIENLYLFSATDGKDGITDTFLSVLRETGTAKRFDDSNLGQLVIAPTNLAIETHFTNHPHLALKAVAPTNKLWLEEWVAERVFSLPPDLTGQTSLAEIKTAIGMKGRWVECCDGHLFLSDEYEVPPQLAPALKDLVTAALS